MTPNPALDCLKPLVGEWKTNGTHPLVPDKLLEGQASFNWIEGGAFLICHSKINEKGFPSGTSIFGSDNATGKIFMLYFDERQVSRKYEVSVQDNIIKWWRNYPNFSQRYSWTLADNNNRIFGKGELCEDGKNWKKDLDLTFTHVK